MQITGTSLRRRLRHAPLLLQQEVSGFVEEVRLLARLRNGHCVFRQSRIDGMWTLVRADEEVGRGMYLYREFEPQESAFIFRNVRDSDTCVDIGANVGFYTLGLAKRATRGAVHSFEPAPLNYHVLVLNVLTNGLSNVVVNHCAVGDKNGTANLCIAQDGAFSSLVDTGRKPIIGTSPTRMITLDFYCSDHALQRIDILKVDVEGAEPAVIRGASRLLADFERRPRLVMLELFEPMLRQFGSCIHEVESLMRSYGYKPFVFAGGRCEPFSEMHHNRFYNVLFVT